MKTSHLITPPLAIRSLCALALFALSVIHAPAFAQVGVSNISSATTDIVLAGISSGTEIEAAAGFTTGVHASGYELSTISFRVDTIFAAPGELRIAIHEVGGDGNPGPMLSDAIIMRDYATSMTHDQAFPSGIMLTNSTPYFVVFSAPNAPGSMSGGSNRYNLAVASDTGSGDTGWSITNNSRSRRNGVWNTSTSEIIAFGILADEVNTTPTPPTASSIALSIVQGESVTIDFAALVTDTTDADADIQIILSPHTATGPGGALLRDNFALESGDSGMTAIQKQANDTYVLTANADAVVGDYRLNYQATDDTGASDTGIITISVTAVPAPVTNFRATLMGDNVSLTWAVRDATTFSSLTLSRNGAGGDMISLSSTTATDYLDNAVPAGTATYTYLLTYTTDDAETDTLTARITITAPEAFITTRPTASVDSMITLAATVNPGSGTISAVSYVWTLTAVNLPDSATLTFPETLPMILTSAIYATTDLPSGTTLTFELTATGTVNAVADIELPRETIIITLTSDTPAAQTEAIVSHVARAIITSTAAAVANRIGNIANGGGVNIAGAQLNNTNLASTLQTHAPAFATNSAAMKTLLGNSAVNLPLNASSGARASGGGVGSVAAWASGEYSEVAGESHAIEWDGDLSGFHIGMDGKINTGAGNQIVVGAAISSLNSEVGYTDETNGTGSAADSGDYEISIITTTPYIGFHSDEFALWASVGVGDGELEITPEVGDKQPTANITQTTIAIGGDAQLLIAGDSYLRINGDAMQSAMDIDNAAKQSMHINRVRVALEAGLVKQLASGGAFDLSLELGVRADDGDGETGTGTELGAQVQYYSARGFTADGGVRALLGHGSGYEEWGVHATIRKESGHDGQGLAFHLTPTYGDVHSRVAALFANEFSDLARDDADNTVDSDYHMKLTSRLGYGFAMHNAGGMVTPYAEIVVGTNDQYRMGINYKPSKVFNLTLLGEQAQNADTENSIRLQGAINF